MSASTGIALVAICAAAHRHVTLGTVASDPYRGRPARAQERPESDFLDGGTLNVYGLGGSLMLDYELFSAAQDIDAELRYSYQHLQSHRHRRERQRSGRCGKPRALPAPPRPLWH